MARQGTRRRSLHYAPDGATLCGMDNRFDIELDLTEDPREVTCGRCMRKREWIEAWRDAAKTARLP